ncbi:Coenzyme F420 hydrogenase/dehydrogenase, beta subunit C-terminal domain [Phocaeicola coprocola]|nr:Coenzyme F420 hydrogenase/dehydrogenase, beta subunit C-terminal domain [Phocaeicola coprocola]MCC3348772.1 Coenzyme F420 hydrogenase/dehydrogenase, beta subunit C-terminal domain [Phocaeicola coprocola DSM 17136]
MITIKDKSQCCGCWACENICPKNCISMKEDNEGFRYPEVNTKICIECGLCEKICPIQNTPHNNNEITDSYVIQHKNNEIRRDSTSGGFFSAICDYVIAQNGYVFGAVYNEKMEVVHYGTNQKEEIKRFRGSKYVQSQIGNTYQETKSLLLKGYLVCFSGTPCQIAGLKNFLRKEYTNLITVDLVCRGNPSPLLLKKYLAYQEKYYNSKITKVKFRDKYYGYDFSTMTLEFQNEKIQYHYGMEGDPMLKFFFLDLCSKPACHQCKFKTIERVSDFTIFDCWNAKSFTKKMDKKGATHVFIHSSKGHEVFEQLKSYFHYQKTDIQQAVRQDGCMILSSTTPSKNREQFFNDLNSLPFDKVQKKYFPLTLKRKLIIKLKPFLYYIGVFKFYMRLKNKKHA